MATSIPSYSWYGYQTPIKRFMRIFAVCLEKHAASIILFSICYMWHKWFCSWTIVVAYPCASVHSSSTASSTRVLSSLSRHSTGMLSPGYRKARLKAIKFVHAYMSGAELYSCAAVYPRQTRLEAYKKSCRKPSTN